MMQRRQLLALPLALAIACLGCGEGGRALPSGELHSLLEVPTLDGPLFDPSRLADKFTLLTFWSPT